MAAIIALEPEVIEQVCAEVSGTVTAEEACATTGETAKTGYGTVVAANYNCDGQTVISGDVAAVEEACERLKAAGAKRAIMLQVGGAFHSPLMEPARAELAEAISKVQMYAPQCPIYQNFTAQKTVDPQMIKQNLLAQLTGPVKWTETIRNMAADASEALGVPGTEAIDFTEIGPGNTLTGLIRKIAY